MKSLYDSALSGISKLMSSKIDGYTESKEAAVSSLEAEQTAAEEAYQAQIDLIQEQIDAIDDLIDEKQKQIDALNDEIDKIREASEARKRDIELQKAQYELERMQNQRTQFIYDGEQMVYRPDESGIRDARENITEIQEEMQIAELEKQISLIEKEIDLLEDQKDALEKQQDALQDMMDKSNSYYEKLIQEQENYWDSLISNLEKQKSKWEELAEIEEIAEAYSAIEQVFGDLGYTVEDVLNGSEGAFEDFKNKYISLINDMNSNSSFAEGLSYATGVAKEDLGSFLDKTQETANGLDELGEKTSALDSIAEGMDNASASATALNTSTEGLNENISGISDSLNNIPTDENLTNLTTAFTNLGDAITSVADALGIGEEGTVGGLVSALQSINEFSLGEDGEGIVSQFQNLKTTIDDVTSAIGSGGGSAGSTGGGDASTSSSPSMSAGANGTGGLTGAINDLKSATDEALGSGGEESSEGEGTGAIGQFEQLKEAVDNVTTSIGGGEDSEGSGGEEDVSSLIGAITNLGDKTEEILVGGEDGGESGGVIGRFEEFKDVIGEANEHVTGISEGLAAIDGQEVECTIKVNIETTGGLPAFAEGTLGNMNLESGEYTAKYGKAYASGYKGLPKAEKNALRSEYGQPELTVYPNGTTELTTSPIMSDLPKGTVIFNEGQTKKIIDNKVSAKGNAHADGTNDEGWFTTPDGIQLRPLQPGDEMYDMIQKFDAYMKSIDNNVEKLVPNTMYEQNRQMHEAVNQINNNNIVNNRNVQPSINVGGINITCPGVTSQEVVKQVGAALEKEFSGLSLAAYQRSHMR